MRTLTKRFFCFLSLICFSAFSQTPKKELPHFFPKGIIQTDIPSQQWSEYMNMISAGKNIESDSNSPNLIPDGIREATTLNGKKIELVFDFYARLDKDHVRYMSYGGTEVISEQKFQIVKNYFLEEIKAAIDLDFDYYKDLRKLALESLSGNLGISVGELEKVLAQKVPENPKFTFEELYWLPKKMEKMDFTAREIHLGYGPKTVGAIGFAWLNSGLVYITPMGLVLDHISGKPIVIQHELVHSNSVLQSLPFAEAFDVELAASIPEMLSVGEHIDLQFHHYVEDLREMAWVFFGYDYKRVHKEVVLFDAGGNYMINAKKFDEYAGMLEKVKLEYQVFFQKAVGEFYGNIVFWSAMHDKLGDNRAVWRVLMRKYYEPVILGGRENTAKWLKANEDNIKADANIAWKASGAVASSENEEMMKLHRLANLIGLDLENKEEVEKFLKAYKIKPSDLQGMTYDQAVNLIHQVLDKQLQKTGGAR